MSEPTKQNQDAELSDDTMEEVAGGVYILPTIPIGPPPFLPEPIDAGIN